MLRKYLLYLVYLSVSTFSSVQAQDWVKSFGHREGNAVVAGVVTDSESNVLITGTFSSAELVISENDVLLSEGMDDVFIIKYNPQGGIVWAQSFGGVKADFAGDIALDSKNNIYITGNFASNMMEIGDSVISSAWPENVYVAKFDASGEFQWLRKSAKLTSWSEGTAVYCEGDQNIFFTGYTRSMEMAFGDIDLSINNSNEKGFYCKLDVYGNYLMADFLGDSVEDRYQVNDISADPQGNIYLAARKTVRTEPDPITYREYRDVMYFCKINPSGEIDWTVEDTSFYLARNIIYHKDSLFVLGNREEYRNIFNGGTIDTTSSFFYGIFDTGSNKLMGRKVTGALAYDLYAENKRILVIGGLLKDHLELDGLPMHRNSDSSSNCPIYQDIFFFESDLSGHINQLHSISGSLEDIPTAIWLSDQGGLLYSGIFESASLTVEAGKVFNFSELSKFSHVSGTYYDRRLFSFLAHRSGYIEPGGMEPPERDRYMIYPNPSAGVIHILRNSLSGSALIRVHDLAGRTLFEQVIHGSLAKINLSDLEAGMVILSVIEGEQMISRPLVIAK